MSFAADRPLLLAHKVRLPEPPRRLTTQDAAITRGIGDAMALRLACHDGKVHRRFSPEGRQARAIFDAVEQARCEAIGSRRMDGVKANLNAMLQDRYHRANLDEVTEQSEAPMEDAVALMVRERLTGAAAAEGGAEGRGPLARDDRDQGRPRARPARHDDLRTRIPSRRPCATSSSRSTWARSLGRRSDDDEEEENEDSERRRRAQ